MSQLRQLVTRFRHDEDGPTMVEYGLMVGLIAIVVAIAAIVLGQNISTIFSNIASYLKTLPTAP
jgi:pilus assembly protein Flp/PilA